MPPERAGGFPGRSVGSECFNSSTGTPPRATPSSDGSAAGAADLAAAAQRAYDDLARASAPLIGQVGVDALTGRTLYLAQQKYPWLARTREPDQWKGAFAQIVFCLERQDPAVATDAAGLVFGTFIGLLVTFIGEPLTEGLLRQAPRLSA